MFKKIQRALKAILNRDYAKAGIYYVIANIIGQGIVLISSAWFTRMMSKVDYGLVSTYSTWVLVINTFICLNLFISVRTAYIDFKDDYDNFNSSILMLSILCGILFTILIVVMTRFWGIGFGIYEVLLACIQSVALNVINLMLAIQSMKNEYRQRVLLMIAPNWTHTIISVLLMVILTGNLYMAKIFGNALGLLIFGVICSIILVSYAKPRIILKYWKYALKISVPSILNTLSDLILIQSDRLMLTSMVGPEETAEYSVVYNVGSIIVAVYQAINGAWLPWFFDKIGRKQDNSIRKYQEYYLLLFSVFSCGMLTISPEIIKVISPENYWKGIRYVPLVVFASYLIYLYSFFSSYLLYMKRTRNIALNTIIAAILNLGLNMWLIPQYKAIGAVIATVVSYSVLFILHMISALRDGCKYFAISSMWLNIAIVILYGYVFFALIDTWFIRYAEFITFAVVIYFITGKKMVLEVLKKKNANEGFKEARRVSEKDS